MNLYLKTQKGTPPNNHHTINIYAGVAKKEIEQSKRVTQRKITSNLSKDEKVALKVLSKRDDIMITNVDEGNAEVIMEVNDYVREANCKLNDSKNYKVLAKDPTTTNNNLFNQTIDIFKKEQLINEYISNELKNQSSRTPEFTYLQKFTKKATQVVLW